MKNSLPLHLYSSAVASSDSSVLFILISSPSLFSTAFSKASTSPTDSVSEMRSSLDSLLVFDSSYRDMSRTSGKEEAGWLHLHQSAAQFDSAG